VRTGSEVPNDAIVKGYELPSGEYLLINDDELARSTRKPRARSTSTSFRRTFAEIDPILLRLRVLTRTRQATVKPYALLGRAMERAQKVGHPRGS